MAHRLPPSGDAPQQPPAHPAAAAPTTPLTHCLSRRYTAVLYRPTDTSTPYLTLPLKAQGTTSFTEELGLPAGPYQLEVATANVWGAGAKSGLTGPFTVGAQGGQAWETGRTVYLHCTPALHCRTQRGAPPALCESWLAISRSAMACASRMRAGQLTITLEHAPPTLQVCPASQPLWALAAIPAAQPCA